MQIVKKIWRRLHHLYVARTAHQYQGWVLQYTHKMDLRLLLNLDHSIDYHIFRFGVFEPQVLAALRHCLYKYSVTHFVDVGSNLGQMSLFVARHFPKVKVISFEPWPENFVQQQACMLVNHLHYDLFQQAVADQEGHLLLYPPKRNPRADYGKVNAGMPSFFADDDREAVSGVAVSSVPLAPVLEKYGLPQPPSYLLVKVDVEGAELLVMKGLRPLFSRNLNLILIVELLFAKNRKNSLELAQMLLDAGFNLYTINHQPVPDLAHLNLSETDFIFIKEAGKAKVR